MNKDNLKTILTILFKQKEQDGLIQNATYNYFTIIAPDSYAPILDGVVSKQLEILKVLLDEGTMDWIEYFLYEAESFYPKCEISLGDKEFIIKNNEDAILFIINECIGKN